MTSFSDMFISISEFFLAISDNRYPTITTRPLDYALNLKVSIPPPAPTSISAKNNLDFILTNNKHHKKLTIIGPFLGQVTKSCLWIGLKQEHCILALA
jgi:hypothetical protein